MEKIQITEEDLRYLIDETLRDLLRNRKKPFEIGVSGRKRLDITDFVLKDKEMSSVIWRSDLNHERIYFRGSVAVTGRNLSDIKILDYDLDITGRPTDDWIDGTREIKEWFDEKVNSPYFLERWDLLIAIKKYIRQNYGI